MRAEKRREARAVFRRLLEARGLVAAPTHARERPTAELYPAQPRRLVAEGHVALSRTATDGEQRPPLVEPLLGGVAALVLFAALALLARVARAGRRRLASR
jgi:hypothetical protein